MSMKAIKKLFLIILPVFFLFSPVALKAETMTSANYIIKSDVISSGGASSTSATYALTDTLGEAFATSTEGTNTQSHGGFWQAAASSAGTLTVTFSKTTISFGDLSTGSVSSDSQVATISTTSGTGYNMQIISDGNLRTGAGADINNVADGEVTAGQEEYGIRTTGADGQYNATDTSVTAISKLIATRAAAAVLVPTTITYKATAGADTSSGNYSQAVTVSVTSNL